MRWLVPIAMAGTITVGGDNPGDRTGRTVPIPTGKVDRTEVSIAEYEAFAAVGYADATWWSTEGWAWAQAHPGGAGAAARAQGRPANHPVVMVTWYEADAYCRWKGEALPDEALWQHAACGEDGRRFPWGNDEDWHARWYGEGKGGLVDTVRTAAVDDSTLVSPGGMLHAAGNVWEWTSDSFGTTWKAVRGGSYLNLPSYCTCAHREPMRPDDARLTVGIRCSSP